MATSSPMLARVWNMMSGQARRGRWEERESSSTASSLARPGGREAREEALQQVKVRVWKEDDCQQTARYENDNVSVLLKCLLKL